MSSVAIAESLIPALAGYGCANVALPAVPLPDHTFRRLLTAAGDERLIGALAEAVADGAFALEQAQFDLLCEHHMDWQGHALRIERLLVDIADAFEAADIDFRVLKGVALAHIVYSDPSWRVYADIDLLIPSAQFDAAVHVVSTKMGGVQEIPELRPGFDHEFGKEALVRVGRKEVDLHRTFVNGPFGLTIDLDGLYRDSTAMAVGGREVRALGPTGLFLHACYNVALGDLPMRWGSVRDLLLCCANLDVDLDEVVATAYSWRATAVVQRAAALTTGAVELAPNHCMRRLVDLEVSRRQAWLLKSYVSPARSYSRQLASLAVIGGVRARFRYLRALVAPSREYLSSRGWSGRTHLRRATRRMFRSRRA